MYTSGSSLIRRDWISMMHIHFTSGSVITVHCPKVFIHTAHCSAEESGATIGHVTCEEEVVCICKKL